MPSRLTGVEVRFIKSKISHLAPYWHSDLDNRPYGRLYYIKKGEGVIRSFGRRYELKPGSLYLIPPRGDHSYGFRKDLQIWWVHFTAAVMSTIDLFDYLPYKMSARAKNIGHTEKQMLRMIDVCMEESTSSQLEASGILLQFLSMFMSDPESELSMKHRAQLSRFAPVLQFIDDHLAERITINQLADLAHYEEAYFTTLFTRVFGIAPSRYIMRRRVDKAQIILRSTDSTLNEVASDLGFSDGFHLSRTFKKYTGISPRDFRQRHEEGLP